MNQQKRRMRELEHKREVERLWQEKLAVYRVEREKEEQERQRMVAEEQRRKEIIEQEKARLLAEHASVLQQHHPKAANHYHFK